MRDWNRDGTTLQKGLQVIHEEIELAQITREHHVHEVADAFRILLYDDTERTSCVCCSHKQRFEPAGRVPVDGMGVQEFKQDVVTVGNALELVEVIVNAMPVRGLNVKFPNVIGFYPAT